jgi:PPOX class probable F420-dependent enzyme
MLERSARDLLDRPGLLGVVCTLRSDGSSQANPVWFRLDGERIRLWTDEERRWVRNLRRDSRVAFSVHENERPWASVTLRGHAHFGAHDPAEAEAEIRRISARYLAPAEIDAYVAGWPQTKSIVTIVPAAAFLAQAFSDPIADRRRGRPGRAEA